MWCHRSYYRDRITNDLNFDEISLIINSNKLQFKFYKNYFILDHIIFNVSIHDMKLFFENKICVNLLIEKNKYYYIYDIDKKCIKRSKVFHKDGKSIKYIKPYFDDYINKKPYYPVGHCEYLKNYPNTLRKEIIKNLLK